MYKLNLQNLNESNWIGSRIALKKNISNMQHFRDMKFKNYPFWRIDKLRLKTTESLLSRKDVIVVSSVSSIYGIGSPKEYQNKVAGELSQGQKQWLEIGMLLAQGPKLLLIDEPAAGMNPKESAELNSLLQFIRDEHKIGVLLIEHDMSVVMEISDHIIVLDYGRKIAEGSPEQVRNDPGVIKAYLGEDEDEKLPPKVAADLQGETSHG